MKRTLRIFTAVIIIASLVLVGFLGLNLVNSTNDKQSSDLSRLQKDYGALQAQYYALLGNYSNVESNYQSVLLQYPSLSNPSGSSPDALDAQQYLARYAALQELYKELQTEYNQYKVDYERLREMSNARLMQGYLTRFITPSDPAVTNITLQVTGELGKSPNDNFNWEPIKAIYDWVNNNIKYRDDGLYLELPSNPADATTDGLKYTDQMAQYPNETLQLRMGDCEDFAVLMASMIRAHASIQAECIWITGANAGHVAVIVPFSEDKVVILDPIRDYYSHDTFGDISTNSISTEIYNWLNIWRPTLGNDVHVYRIFSDYMDKYFESTQEFIDWQYSR